MENSVLKFNPGVVLWYKQFLIDYLENHGSKNLPSFLANKLNLGANYKELNRYDQLKAQVIIRALDADFFSGKNGYQIIGLDLRTKLDEAVWTEIP